MTIVDTLYHYLEIQIHLNTEDELTGFCIIAWELPSIECATGSTVILYVCIPQVQVGILDIDLCGPSVPRMLNLEGSNIHQCSTGYTKLLSVMCLFSPCALGPIAELALTYSTCFP